MLNELGISKRQVLGYTLLPGIWPRIRDLAGTGFYTLARLIAIVFYTVRILPATHPYLQISNRGKFGIRHVLAEAANHIVVSRNNIDQMVVFVAVIAGLVILTLQFLMIVMIVISPPAIAATMPTTLAGFFKTTAVDTDLAFKFLNLVFGFPGIFGNGPETTTAFHKALHALFEFYNYGIFTVGFIIILYHVISIVAETAQTGVPFSERFNHVWAPVRIIIFLGFLVPFTSYGLNLGQLAALGAANAGSGLATNGWLKFNEVLTTSVVGEQETLVGTPQAPDMSYLLAYMMIAKTCGVAYGRQNSTTIDAFAITGPLGSDDTGKATNAFSLSGDSYNVPKAATAQDIIAKANGGDIRIIFGEYKTFSGKKYTGKKDRQEIRPICGELVVQASDISEPGSAVMQQAYFKLVMDLWNGMHRISEFAENYSDNYQRSVSETTTMKPEPDDEYKTRVSKTLKELIEADVDKAVKDQISNGKWSMTEEIKQLGWGGAGIWYNKIAQQNGALMTSVQNAPKIVLQPAVVEYIREQKAGQDRIIEAEDLASPKLADGTLIKFREDADMEIASVLHKVYSFWAKTGFTGDNVADKAQLTGNIIIDAINMIFGTQGLFSMCKNVKIHPLAQLSMVGKGLIESSIAAFGGTIFFGAAGAMAKAINEHLAAAGFAMSKFFTTVAGIGLLAGFVLFYLVPFMPFIYFFFALGSWVKGLFEAMVGIPLWILAHLDIKGEGIAGDNAESGYYLLFEIFIRPVLIIVGLIASVTVFAAMVRVLNEIFYLVVANLSGHNAGAATTQCFQPPGGSTSGTSTAQNPIDYMRGPIDEFFYTVVYAIVVYMIGMSCFKLIDLIPNNVMRWIGAGVSSFGDQHTGIADSITGKITAGGAAMGSQLNNSLGGLGGFFDGD
jgi:conjugal transfer/type IV secretion protein DotA/TraY